MSKEHIEQIDELSNEKLSAYKKAVAAKPLAKDGDKTAGGILRTAQKRVNGVKMANKKLGEATEINEKAMSLLKAVLGKSDKQKAAKASADFAARRKARLEREAAAKKSPATPSSSDPWAHVEMKRGTNVREEAEQVDEAAVKIPAHDELEGNLPHAPSEKATAALATKGQMKMLAMAARSKYVSHTNIEVPGTQVKEEAEQIDELSKKTLISYTTKAARSAADNAYDAGLHHDKPSALKSIRSTSKTFKRLDGIHGATERLAKEEVEQIDELSNEKLGAYKKAAGADASAADKSGNFAKGNKRFSGIIKATKKQFANDAKKTNEEVEQIDELSKKTLGSYVKKASSDAVTSAAVGGNRLGLKMDGGDEKLNKSSSRLKGVYKAVGKLTKESMISFKDYLKMVTEEFEVESEELSEEFISHSEFESKVANHKNNGMVVHHDYDHRAKKAIIRHVDHDGEVREFHYHEKGTTVQRLAPKRRPGTAPAPTEKRGRGRPAGSKNK